MIGSSTQAVAANNVPDIGVSKGVTVTFPTLVAGGESFWESIEIRCSVESHGEIETIIQCIICNERQ